MKEDTMVGVIDELETKFGLTDALGHVLRYALNLGCHMVNFDRDADQISSLGWFEDNYETE
jgi:hypothetical protein